MGGEAPVGLGLLDGAFPAPKRASGIRPRVSSRLPERRRGAARQMVHGGFVDGTGPSIP